MKQPATLELNKAHWPVTVLGPGRRIGLWVQGCSIHCPGCVSQDTWPKDPARAIAVPELIAWCRKVTAGTFDGVTISGGEPFEQPAGLAALLEALVAWRRERHLDADERVTCEGCQFEFCENCAESCEACSASRCRECLKACSICRAQCCPGCLGSASSGTSRCPECRDDEKNSPAGSVIETIADSSSHDPNPEEDDDRELAHETPTPVSQEEPHVA